MADLVGFGVAIASGSHLVKNFPKRTYRSMLIPLLQEDKRAGRLLRLPSCSQTFSSYLRRSIPSSSSFKFLILLVLGESTRRGFYIYDEKRKAVTDPGLQKYIEKARNISNVIVDSKVLNFQDFRLEINYAIGIIDCVLLIALFFPQLTSLSEKDIVEMIFFPVVNEACRVLAEGIAVKASDLDVASVMGMGFPPYRYVYFGYRMLLLSQSLS